MKVGLLIAFMWVVVMPLFAQNHEASLEDWHIEERCLADPVHPEANWDFVGEILLEGWAGIHAVNAERDTPYIVHWGSGVLSPSGSQLLVWDYDSFVERNEGGGPLAFYNYTYHDIKVVNLDSGEETIFPWSAGLSISSGPYPLPPAGPIWLDDNSFVSFYGWGGGAHRVGNLETGDVTEWNGVSLQDYEVSISPDQSRVIAYSQLYDQRDNMLITEAAVGTNYDGRLPLWSPDSAYFVDILTNYDDDSRHMTLFDRDGNLIAQPITEGENGFFVVAWSPDSTQFVFIQSYFLEGAGITSLGAKPYLVDIQAELIYDLCLDDVRGWAWSPDGSGFATLLGAGQQPVIIVHADEWQPYIVAYHSGAVLKWR